MIALTLDNLSFDKEAIFGPSAAFTTTLLGKFGAYCRTTQRNLLKMQSMKRKVSSPGEPPLRHAGANPDIKETVMFDVDIPGKNVVIGMVLLRNKSESSKPPMPGILEYGGTTYKMIGKFKGVATERRRVDLNVDPRPSAVPAFHKTAQRYMHELLSAGLIGLKP